MGLGAAGGTSQRLTGQQSNNFLGALNQIGLNKQNYIDQQHNAISQEAAQNQANIANITAQSQMAKNAALQQQKNMIAQQFLSMYLAGRLTKRNYEDYMNQLNAM